MLFRHGCFANYDAGEEERFVGQVVDVVGFVDPGVGDETVGVGADGGFDVVFGGDKEAGQGEGRGDVLGPDEQGVVVCVGIFGYGVEGEVEAGFVAHGGGFKRVEGGGGGVGNDGSGAAVGGFGDEGVRVVWVWVAGTWDVYARLI